jgi:predicted DNA-binding ribbon-helix-helix protein
MCKVFAEQDPARYESKTRSLRLNGQITSGKGPDSCGHVVV